MQRLIEEETMKIANKAYGERNNSAAYKKKSRHENFIKKIKASFFKAKFRNLNSNQPTCNKQ